MATIIPGYDFGTSEIPTRDTLLRQARFLQVSGIGLESIDSSLLGLVNGSTSGTTGASLPTEGWMWADPEGSWWIEGDHGPVRFKRAGGGWESNRYGINRAASEGTTAWHPGYPAGADPTAAAADQTETSMQFRLDFLDSSNGGVQNDLITAATADSATSWPRLVGRGMTHFYVAGVNSRIDKCINRGAVIRITSTVRWETGWAGPSNTVPPASQDRMVWYGSAIAPDSATSLVSGGGDIYNMHDLFWGYKWDGDVWGQGVLI